MERRYSQTEREALGIVWACERLHTYLFGTRFWPQTDLKPLEFIYSSRSKPSARIERWVLRLQPYDLVVKHIPGESNIADSLSRLLDADQLCPEAHRDDEEAVQLVAQADAPFATGVQEVERESATDSELSEVHSCIRKWILDQLPAAYKNMRFELTTLDRLVLRGQRSVIPQALRQRTVSLAHEGHQGIVKTKERLRTNV